VAPAVARDGPGADGSRPRPGQAIGGRGEMPPHALEPGVLGCDARVPGGRRIEGRLVTLGPTPGVYAFYRGATQRNLYRIPIP